MRRKGMQLTSPLAQSLRGGEESHRLRAGEARTYENGVPRSAVLLGEAFTRGSSRTWHARVHGHQHTDARRRSGRKSTIGNKIDHPGKREKKPKSEKMRDNHLTRKKGMLAKGYSARYA